MSNTSSLKCVLIMAGGTGGHVFPGLAIAKSLQAQGVAVHWLGTERGLESKVVPSSDIPLHLVAVSGLRGKGVLKWLSAPIKLIRAVMESMRIIKQVRPDAVIGLGGFVSGPGGLASYLLGCPLVIHEQNARAGLTNKLLKPLAKRVLTGFPNAFPQNHKVAHVGNPVRLELLAGSPPAEAIANRKPFRLLVLGGSLGAKAINDLLPEALALMPDAERPQVVHQAGANLLEQAKAAYDAAHIKATVLPFIEDMAHAYREADMVLCRAGALTVAELCAVGRGAILIPYPYAVDDHQTINAQFLVDHHAAICIQQRDLTKERLAELLLDFARSPEKRLAMGEAAYQLRRTQVTETVCAILSDVID